MLQIGFATKYFTLWDVRNETEYSGSEGQYSYNVTHFTYIQNLSLVEETAIAKQKKRDVLNWVLTMSCVEVVEVSKQELVLRKRLNYTNSDMVNTKVMISEKILMLVI